MPRNPFTDVWLFLTASTDDYLALGGWRYVVLALFYALMAAGIGIAVRNWAEDPAQRTGTHVGTWVARVLVGCMWFEGMLWKLPLPVGGGLQYWTEQMATRAAFEVHRELVTNVLLPYVYLFWPNIFLALLMFLFALHAAGRSLGLDAWLRRHMPAVRDGSGFLGKLFNVAG